MFKKWVAVTCGVVVLMAAGFTATAQDSRSLSSSGASASPQFRTLWGNCCGVVPDNGANWWWLYSGQWWRITGIAAPKQGGSQSVGQAFTLTADATLAEAFVGVQYANYGDGATRNFEISLYSDADGIPGAILAGPFSETAKANAGACCGPSDGVVAKFPGTPLTAGTQYWIVVDVNNAKDAESEVLWAFPNGTVASDSGNGWVATNVSNGGAMVLEGTN